MNKDELGAEGEMKALTYLDREGYEILDRNFRCRMGELDIVARKAGVISFVEVKTRSSLRHGTPGAAVDARKLEHIQKCAQVYMKQKKPVCVGMRIDVIEVLKIRGKFFMRHLRAVGQ